MNRRDFVSRVALGGAAAACTSLARLGACGAGFRSLQVPVHRHDGIRRTQGSLVPGRHPGPARHHHMHPHAISDGQRKSSPLAKALGMVPAPGVVPAAFDTELEGTRPGGLRVPHRSRTRRSRWSRARPTRGERSHSDGALAEHRSRQAGPRQHREMGVVDDLAARRPDREFRRPSGRRQSCGRSAAYSQRLTDAVNYRTADGADHDPADERHRSADLHDRRRRRRLSCG